MLLTVFDRGLVGESGARVMGVWYLGGSGEIVLIVFARGLLEGGVGVCAIISLFGPAALEVVAEVTLGFGLS